MQRESELILPVRAEEEGGCGVVGLIANVPVAGRHILRPSLQMHNRGNGKGGGIAAAGLDPAQMGVTPELLRDDYLIQVAYLDSTARFELELTFFESNFDIHQVTEVVPIETTSDIKPPEVVRAFVRVKPAVLDKFISKTKIPAAKAEDEFVYQNSYAINQAYYASLGQKRAFVMSHAKNLLVFKVVGYAEDALTQYRLEDLRAHAWIAHQRYPTKGRVWHPGGAHPFVGLHEALVHNGDFANYHSICEYLAQRNLYPQFLTDTEVAALLFDLWKRGYDYPLEYVIEALAPTTERDFDLLPVDKKRVYRAIQAAHIHGSPDGPWFFIILRNDPNEHALQLIGITDTSMLRPQVFALYQGKVQIGLIASEKQAIDATLASLASEDRRFCPVADRFWNARGGSHTDGGAFVFTLKDGQLRTTDKFGREIRIAARPEGSPAAEGSDTWLALAPDSNAAFEALRPQLAACDFDALIERLLEYASSGHEEFEFVRKLVTLMVDRRYPLGAKKRSECLARLYDALGLLLSRETERFVLVRQGDSIPTPDATKTRWAEADERHHGEQTLVIDARDFAPEGDAGLSRSIHAAYASGWRRMIVFNCRGQRFIGSGLGLNSEGLRIDVYGSPGDYLASGLDGAEIHVHASGQDQLAQIMRRGKLVVHGDVGQTFMYGAKGGEVWVLGSAAGRPLINAVGRPRVVINGTCLDYLAESFMAGDPLKGGGFVIVNGIALDDDGQAQNLETPYAGGNLFSLASGGAIYLRDPEQRVEPAQLNGGKFSPFTPDDWELIRPYLEENEHLFGITIQQLLRGQSPYAVYRKVEAVRLAALGVTYEGE